MNLTILSSKFMIIKLFSELKVIINISLFKNINNVY